MWAPVALYVLVIFALSSISEPPGVPPVPYFDKLVHFVEYGILGLLMGRALGVSREEDPSWRLFAVALALGACVGIADELYQGTVAGRERSAADFAADVLGLAAAQLTLRYWALRQARRRMANS